MKLSPTKRTWRLVLAFGTIALLVVTVFATQSKFAIGLLVPFAYPSDNPNNDIQIFEFSLPHPSESIWHYHTGDLYGVVRQGTIIEDLGCGNVKESPTGTGYHTPFRVVHQVRNAVQIEVQTSNFQMYPHSAPFAVPAPEPTCP